MVACGACGAHCKLNLLPSSRSCNLMDKRSQFSIIIVLLTSTIENYAINLFFTMHTTCKYITIVINKTLPT